MKKLIKGSLASEIETARKVNEIVEWINKHEKEDVPEEPKSINEIDVVLDAIREYCNEHLCHSEDWEKIKILNNVEEKLKAWQRLKDKGFRFDCVSRYENLCGNGFEIPITAIMPPEQYTDKAVAEDLNMLFSGEDD